MKVVSLHKVKSMFIAQLAKGPANIEAIMFITYSAIKPETYAFIKPSEA